VSAEARLSVTGQRVSNAVVAVGTGTGVAGVMTRRQTQVTAAGLCTGICHCKTHTHTMSIQRNTVITVSASAASQASSSLQLFLQQTLFIYLCSAIYYIGRTPFLISYAKALTSNHTSSTFTASIHN